jgi:glycosyltransferase involved in cell wall biosynthesis
MPGDYVIGICAALRPEKAHGDYLRAIAGLRARGTPARGLIIGDGPQRPDVERQIQMLGLDRHVTITGMQNDVRPYIVACDVMTLTSHSVETFSLAALESMAMRKPVVMTDIGGAREQVEHGVNGLLYRHGDIDALITNLMELSNVALRDRMASDSLERVTRCFSLPTMIDAYTEALSALAVDRRDTTPGRRHGPKLSPAWRDSDGTRNS